MAAIIVIVTLALLYRVSAENSSTTMILPDFFFAAPNTRTFSGEMTVTGSTTYYTLNCDPNNYDFWPGPIGCNEYSYTFSASSAITQYLMVDVNLGGGYPFTIAPLQSFNQTVTIDCGPLNPVSTAHCMYTSLYNNENADDKSIISPTIVTKTNLKYESALYAVFFTTTTSTTIAAVAAAAAISTPLNSVASSTATTTTTNPPPTITSYAPSSPTDTIATMTNPPSSTTTSSMLSKSTPSPTAPPTSNPRPGFSIPIDVSIGVSVGVCVLAVSLLLIAVATISKIRSRTLGEI